MTMKKRGLGRGLDVLIKSRNVEPEHEAEIVTLDINALEPNIHQPRHHFDQAALEELAASIKSQGLIQPVLVRPLPTGHYELVAGERRWRACRMAGLDTIDCIVRRMDDHESMAIALIENLQREDLNPIEEARALGQIKEHFKITQEELADKIGKSRPAVTNSLRLLKLPEKVQNLLETNALSAGHARALLGLDDPESMTLLAEKVLQKNLNVRATEELVKKIKNRNEPEEEKPRRAKPMAEDIADVVKALAGTFTVKHSGTPKKGKIVFAYASNEEREKIASFLERMAKEQEI
ncbi:chromosome partitioning protein, ParB family [Desulfomicrobium norvegicum]|uniref:Chromosome partitioning protein, ParB family n=1 Tax=Desulfomicrobium norvegicum (strain DSM 1741 / NCIMB 8310) TaxID=52561 RepID=A0A8G2C0V7_DESNO|nr:ParB/RepB/Spo0J family partition protein [Desulfomicrobium norvegicum]SFL42436.1 chromosome partitioning protein, ParB family [Desulfomicrobium norvegicum]